jgi:hypothetical protein
MLLRSKPLNTHAYEPGQQLIQKEALDELRYQVFSEMLHQKAREDDAATLALQGMPGAAGYAQQDVQLLERMGLRQGQQLTAEQVRVHAAASIEPYLECISLLSGRGSTAVSMLRVPSTRPRQRTHNNSNPYA